MLQIKSKKSMLQLKSEGSRLENSLLLRKSQPFVLLRPSTDWTRPTHLMEGNLFYSKSTDTSLIRNSLLTETSRIMFGQISMALTSWYIKLFITGSKTGKDEKPKRFDIATGTPSHWGPERCRSYPRVITHGGIGWGLLPRCIDPVLAACYTQAEWLWQLEKVLREGRQVLVVESWVGVKGNDMESENCARCRQHPSQGPFILKDGSKWYSQDSLPVSCLCFSEPKIEKHLNSAFSLYRQIKHFCGWHSVQFITPGLDVFHS